IAKSRQLGNRRNYRPKQRRKLCFVLGREPAPPPAPDAFAGSRRRLQATGGITVAVDGLPKERYLASAGLYQALDFIHYLRGRAVALAASGEGYDTERASLIAALHRRHECAWLGVSRHRWQEAWTVVVE